MANQAEIVALIVAGVSGVILFPKLPSSLRYLTGLIWFGLSIEGVASVFRSQHQPNLFLIPIDAAGELCLLSIVYGRALQLSSYSRWWPWVVGTFVLYAALSSWLVPDAASFQPTLLVSESLLVLTLVGLYFSKLLRELRVQRLSQDPMFWISTGLLLYFLGKLQIALFSNYALQHYSKELNLWVWTIHALLLLVLHSCYCLALWIRPQK